MAPISVTRFTATLLLCLVTISSHVQASLQYSDDQVPIFIPPFTPLQPTAQAPKLELQLRHIFHHGTRRYPGLLRKMDIAHGRPVMVQYDDDDVTATELLKPLTLSSQDMHITRLADRSPDRLEALQLAGLARGHPVDLPASAWTSDKIRGPNITDKATVLAFGKMASNAYVTEPFKGDWEDVGGGFNYTEDFGWQAEGLRGHIFADTENKTVVLGLKGTSVAIFDGEETTTQDKINDNLFFSCCCGQGGSTRWLAVCDCKTDTYTCNSTCLVKALRKNDRYYDAAKQLYHNVTALYPNAQVWLAGHSLGGAVASLLGLTYGLPVVTFGAPGDAMPAARLGLPTPPEYHIGSYYNRTFTGGFHFGHTADPIFTGSCNGWTSTCSIAGYAMESLCHTGYSCTYDTVKDKGWRNNMLNHRIGVTLHSVIEAYDKVARCEPVTECWDCYAWKYFESNGTTTTRTSSSSATFTKTRTETCKTPGWWGCRDATTTSSLSSSTSIHVTTPTTTICQTPGWFGCKDPTTTTATTESTTKTSTSLSRESCSSLGWWGCKDETMTAGPSSPTATPAPSAKPVKSTATSSCKTKGLLGGCKDGVKEPDESPWSIPTRTAFAQHGGL